MSLGLKLEKIFHIYNPLRCRCLKCGSPEIIPDYTMYYYIKNNSKIGFQKIPLYFCENHKMTLQTECDPS